MAKKYLGTVLLLSGLAMIFVSLYFSYSIFTGKQAIPQVFKIEIQSKVSPSANANGPLGIQEQINKVVSEKIKDILPQEYIDKLLNLMSWSIFAWILLVAGSIVSGLGIKILK